MDTKIRIIKSIVYRLLRILIVFLVAVITLSEISIGSAVLVSVLDAIIATIYYYYFDSIWDKYAVPVIKRILIHIKYKKFDEDDIK